VRRASALALAGLLTGAGALPAQAQAQVTNDPHAPNPAISAKLTCRELLTLLQPDTRNTGGLAIIWLDGYVAGNIAAPGLSAGWIRDVAEGVGAMCRLGLNSTRTVTDVIAELRHQYDATHPKPAAAQ
jgi:hypothetical protein